ncbi:uncharacterized protein LOC134263918 [Saccostrea cucullata]|uniref:uncharacterized protein LOC134263918 n=1 Tax=Saccostrea cuccullata TaxID=36930 RepID=UPI002ED6AEA7
MNFLRMASRPKRRRTSTKRQDPPTTTTSERRSEDVSIIFHQCMSKIMPTIEETLKTCMDDYFKSKSASLLPPTASSPPPTAFSPQPTASSPPPPGPLEPSTTSPATTLLSEITGQRVPNTVSLHGSGLHPCEPSIDKSLNQTAESLLYRSLSPSTVAAYKSAFQAYKLFILQTYGEEMSPLPPCLEHLAYFIANCYQTNLAASTNRTIISALSFIFQLSSSQDVTQHFIIKKMLQGFLKAKPIGDPRLPITPDILLKLVQALPYTADSYFSTILLRAMFILAYCAFLRVGEITKTNSKTHHYLLAKHVSKGNKTNGIGFLELAIPHFKHSKSNSTTIHLCQNTINPLLCPYRAITDFLNIRKHDSPEAPLFSFMDNTPVPRQYFTSQLRLAI